MSIISLLVGQCGNQVGSEFFETIFDDNYGDSTGQINSVNEDFIAESTETFFNTRDGGKPEARCIQIDMEEKVIRRINDDTNRLRSWRFSKNAFCSKSGSGNNWAMGYLLNGPSCMKTVSNMLFEEMEKCDSIDGLLLTMSVAGGTGSGVGAYILRNLGDICPKIPVLVQLVWPYRRGEIATQYYNAILSLGQLLREESSYGLIFHENDILHRACTSRQLQHRLSRFIGQVPLVELNRLMSHLLGGVLQPHIGSTQNSPIHRRRLSRLLFELAGPPDYRLYRLHCLPYYLDKEARCFAIENWPQIFRHGRQLLLTGACFEDRLNWDVSFENLSGQGRQPLLSCSGVARGVGAGDLSWSELTASLSYTDGIAQPWNDNTTSMVCLCNRSFNGHPRGLFLATNGGGLLKENPPSDYNWSTDICAPLRFARSRAWRLFTTSAYLHQYAQFGMEDPRVSFLEAFAVIDQTIHCYTRLKTS